MTRERRLLVPEVIQSSALDCGPAALKSLAGGFGISVGYGRLREACQTGVDGTSIDAVESVARQLGLGAEQVILPADHLLLPEANALPAIVVIRNPGGMTHFVVAWRIDAGRVQVMDPATGRRFRTRERFISDLYIHHHPVPAAAWKAWARGDEFTAALTARLARLGLGGDAPTLIGEAAAHPCWRGLATLDAATRLTASLIAGGALRPGAEAARPLRLLRDDALARPEGGETEAIPAAYWMVRPHPPGDDGEERLLFRGAVLVRVRGQLRQDAEPSGERVARRDPEVTTLGAAAPQRAGAGVRARWGMRRKSRLQRHAVRLRGHGPERPAGDDAAGEERTQSPASAGPGLLPEIRAALEERSPTPGRRLLALLAKDGALAPAAIGVALTAAAMGTVLEALLFRGLLDAGRALGTPMARAGFVAALLALSAVLLAIELATAGGVRRAGRHLEARLRIAFLRKLPRLGDRYFHSRLMSDMAERAHAVHTLRMLPELAGRTVRAAAELLVTVAAIAWLDPPSAAAALLAAAAALGVPLAMHGFVAERDLRVRSHQGALSRFYLDALLGLTPVRAHGAERSVRREHEMLVAEWARACLGLFRALASADAVSSLTGYGAAAWIILAHAARAGASGRLLLLAYWALALPALGQSLALLVRQYLAYRNVALRLFEPLESPEEEAIHLTEGTEDTEELREASDRFSVSSVPSVREAVPSGISITLHCVHVEASGTEILRGVDLHIDAGEHVAVVGPSGAGKSTLVGLLLGWHRPARGEVRVDGRVLDGMQLRRLRACTAWVDPAVQLWNRSAAENLAYGADPGLLTRLGDAVEAASLGNVVRRLPQGLRTPLGEGGARVSGGEGQRMRFARAWLRRDARLLILDEPFRGLDRDRRHALLAEARRAWRGATLLCVTHDLSETAGFDRVLVVEDGAIAEDGAPDDLLARPESRYSALLAAEAEVRARFACGPGWRRIRLQDGVLVEEAS
ncbi:MAG: ATP-binding cassette domain-containing protein [Gemmatimonadetes bacterium]|nr:ATP-binding cassette domain-containing protein [Gemmatimonadota bacterium]